MTTAIVAGAATTAGATVLPSDPGQASPPTTYGCQSEPGPVSQTVAYAGCQTVAVIDGIGAMICDLGLTC